MAPASGKTIAVYARSELPAAENRRPADSRLGDQAGERVGMHAEQLGGAALVAARGAEGLADRFIAQAEPN